MRREGAETVWIIDEDHWPRACLRAELIERGYDAIGFAGAEEARAAVPTATTLGLPAIAVVDVGPGEPGGIEELAPLLAEHGVALVGVGRAVGAGGEAEAHPPWRMLLHRPITLGQIADVVDRLADARRPGVSHVGAR